MKTIKCIIITIVAMVFLGCIHVDIDEHKLQQAVEVKEFLDSNEVSLQKLKKCLDLVDQIELNGAKVIVTNDVMVIEIPVTGQGVH